MDGIKTVSGQIVDVLNSEIYAGSLVISRGRIVDIVKNGRTEGRYIIPGFIDSHVHIESSMLVPSEFARAAVVHGTVAAVSDPHEIANVLGVDGVTYMVENSRTVPMKFYFGAPSCVPATGFETNGSTIGPGEIEELFRNGGVKYLAEVMNFPGVINGDPDLLAKIRIAKEHSKAIDGHAPGLRGRGLERYVNAGITTDHESLSREEAVEKIRLGMKILIREGSAARYFDELISIVDEDCESCMFCSDDKHPDDLIEGHINDLLKRAVAGGLDCMKALRVACVNPVLHYGLDTGLLKKGDSADFLVVDNLKDFGILRTYIRGELVAEEGKPLIPRVKPKIINNFAVGEKVVDDFNLPYAGGAINVIGAEDGQLVTGRLIAAPRIVDGRVMSDVERDILKIAVVNRYGESKVATGFIKNFGLKKGAIASSVAHDSHNIVAVGVGDEDICRAVNLIIRYKGGVSAVSPSREMILPLPVAGIMSDGDYSDVAGKYYGLNCMAKQLGSTLHAPFMTLSFMALLVIPSIKLSDRGLFDGERFRFINVFGEGNIDIQTPDRPE